MSAQLGERHLKHSRWSTPRAFTLIELLIVVCILAVMAGLVIPLMGTTQDAALKDVTVASMSAVREAIMGGPSSAGYHLDMKYIDAQPPNKVPQTIRDLFVRPRLDGMRSDPDSDPESVLVPRYDPATRKGWRGPYLNPTTEKYLVDNAAPSFNGFTTAYGFQDTDGIDPDTSDPALLDAWRHPIVLQPVPNLVSPPALEDMRLVSAGPNGKIETNPARTGSEIQADIAANLVGDDVIIFLRPKVHP
jgi:prepilin-type N-terminal cleavage/methylation domain-containing protein